MDTTCSRSIPDSGNSQSRRPEAGRADGGSRNSKEAPLAENKNLGGEAQDPGQGGKEMSLLLFFFICFCVCMCVHCKDLSPVYHLSSQLVLCLCLTEILSLI